MTTIHSPDQILLLFSAAGYSINPDSAEIIMDYLSEADIHLETDSNKIFMNYNGTVNETTLKDILSFAVKENEKRFLQDTMSSRDYTNSLIEEEKALMNIKSSVVSRFSHLLKQTFKSGSAASFYAAMYKQTLDEYYKEKDPELNYRFFTEKTAKKMFESGKFSLQTIQNIVGLYAPEAIINNKDYGSDVVSSIADKIVNKQRGLCRG